VVGGKGQAEAAAPTPQMQRERRDFKNNLIQPYYNQEIDIMIFYGLFLPEKNK